MIMVSCAKLPLSDFSIAIFGAGGVGKTSLLNSFMDKPFTGRHIPTVDDYYVHSVVVDGNFLTVCIVDTAGSYTFPVMKELALNSCHGFIIMYALDNMASFEEAVKIMQEISKLKGHSDTHIPAILVGNKLDIDVLEREVTARQGHEALASLSRLQGEYIETSAKMDFRVDKVFLEIIRTLIKNDRERRKNKLPRIKLSRRQRRRRKVKKLKQSDTADCNIM